MHRHRILALLVCAAAVAACDKNARQSITAPAVGARVKFFNFGVGAPGVNFFAGSTKLTAISSTSCQPPNDTTTVCRTNGIESTNGVAYSAAGNGALYNEVAPGSVTLAGKIAATTDNGLAVASTSATLDDGKYYSFFVSGVYDATGKKADAFVVEDPIPSSDNIDFTQAQVRLVNASSNVGTMILYAKNTLTGTEVALGSTVAYKAAGAFTSLPAGVYDLNTRASGSTTNIVTRLAVSFVGGHVYTVTARGDATSAVTASKPALDNTANR
ncbi:MAG: DUF4397 domain-containing protein [Gemmatimonadaceae bacterium]